MLALGISCLNLDIFMFSILDLMSENPAHMPGRTIFTMTKNISSPSFYVLKVYIDLKYLNLQLLSVVKEFLIHRPIIFDLRRC